MMLYRDYRYASFYFFFASSYAEALDSAVAASNLISIFALSLSVHVLFLSLALQILIERLSGALVLSLRFAGHDEDYDVSTWVLRFPKVLRAGILLGCGTSIVARVLNVIFASQVAHAANQLPDLNITSATVIQDFVRIRSTEASRRVMILIGRYSEIAGMFCIVFGFFAVGALLYPRLVVTERHDPSRGPQARGGMDAVYLRLQRRIALVGAIFFATFILRFVYVFFTALAADGWGFWYITSNICAPLTVASPCDPCLSTSFIMSVWLAYAPLFKAFVNTLSGPFPLLIVLADIYKSSVAPLLRLPARSELPPSARSELPPSFNPVSLMSNDLQLLMASSHEVTLQSVADDGDREANEI